MVRSTGHGFSCLNRVSCSFKQFDLPMNQMTDVERIKHIIGVSHSVNCNNNGLCWAEV